MLSRGARNRSESNQANSPSSLGFFQSGVLSHTERRIQKKDVDKGEGGGIEWAEILS
jgi:hypothetical protein